MASWSYARALEEGNERLSKKERQSEYESVERVSKRTKARLQRYYQLYGHDPQEEVLPPHRYEGPLPCIDSVVLSEAVSFDEACLAQVDCDEWEMEQRMRQKGFKPNWFLKWLFEHGMYVP